MSHPEGRVSLDSAHPVTCGLQIGQVDEGIVCSAWSPDEELLAICTTARQVVLMSKVYTYTP